MRLDIDGLNEAELIDLNIFVNHTNPAYVRMK